MRDIDTIIIIGDRVLIAPDKEKQKTSSGLFLPQGLANKENVSSGLVVRTGPGYVVPIVPSSDNEPWESNSANNEPHYVPLQIKEGDQAIFLRKEAVEIEYNNQKYLIVPQSGILAVVRDNFPEAL